MQNIHPTNARLIRRISNYSIHVACTFITSFPIIPTPIANAGTLCISWLTCFSANTLCRGMIMRCAKWFLTCDKRHRRVCFFLSCKILYIGRTKSLFYNFQMAEIVRSERNEYTYIYHYLITYVLCNCCNSLK